MRRAGSPGVNLPASGTFTCARTGFLADAEHRRRQLLRATLSPKTCSLGNVRRLMERVAFQAALDQGRLYDLQLVVSETCATALDRSKNDVAIAAWLLRDRIVVEVTGEPGNALATAQHGVGGVRLGLPLMASFADQIQISRLSKGLSMIALTFLLEPGTEAESSGRPGRARLQTQIRRLRLLEDPHVHGVALSAKEAREQRVLGESLARQAFQDPLTGLPNRALFFQHAELALARARRHGTTIALFLVDLDDFKAVNDSLGHAAGDSLLIEVGGRLKDSLRGEDVAARLGGDEFVVLLVEGSEAADMTSAADRILARVQQPCRVSSQHLKVSVSMGVAMSTRGTTSVMQLLSEADLAMYATKSGGKGGWRLFDPEMAAVGKAKRDREAELRRAIDDQKIVPYFQPILSTRAGRILGFEALARWRNPAGAPSLPDAFLDLAKETGLIVPLGQQVLEQALSTLRWWDAYRPGFHPQMMVNLSERELAEVGVVDRISEVLAGSGVPPYRLVLEVDEHVFGDAGAGTLETLAALGETGIRLAIDNYGTGGASISSLALCPVSMLKMARPFVQAIDVTGDGGLMAAAVIGLAKALHLQIVAEGVEQSGQLVKLRSLGCEMWQGNYYSSPVPPEELPVLLQRRVAV